MKIFIISTVIISFISIINLQATVYYSIDSGDWSDGTNWSLTSGGATTNDSPAKGDDVHIEGHAITLDSDMSSQPGIEIVITLGGSLTSSSTEGILIAAGGDLNISNGSLNVYTVELKNGANVSIGSSGSLTTDTWVTTAASITVDGSMTVGTTLTNTGTITGTGIITAASFAGTGTTFGITNNTISDGASVSGYTWDGDQADSEWNTAANWVSGSSPSASTHNVVIPAGLSYYPTISTSDELCADLTVESGATVTIGPGADLSVNGTLTSSAVGGVIINSTSGGSGSLYHTSDNVQATVKRYITGNSDLEQNAYHLVSVPLDASNTNLYSNLFLESYLFDFDESYSTAGGWYSYGTSTTTALPVTQGYMIYYPGSNKTYSFEGKLNNGSFSCDVTYTSSSHGYNLVPNPYSFDIDWDASSGWTKNNIGASIWIYNSSEQNYGTWNGTTGTNSVTNKIAVGQAFFVLASGTPTLNMTNAVKTSGATFLKEVVTLSDHLRIKILADGYSDEAVIHFRNDGSFGVDPRNDAAKLFGAEFAPQLWTLAGADMLSINTLPFSYDNVLVPLCIEYMANETCTFSFEDIESFDTNTSIELHDLVTDDIINLRENPSYSFEYNTLDDPDRFVIHFNGVTSVEDKEQKWANIYKSGDKLFINALDTDDNYALLEIFNSAGQKILSSKMNITGRHVVDFRYPKGLYIVVLSKNKHVIKRKFIN